MTINRIGRILVCAAGLAAAAATHAQRVVNVYNWSDYIGDEVVARFEADTGIRVVYDVFDSNEVLEGKLLAGRTGYDVVVPSNDFLARQIKAGVFQPLQKDKLSNYGQLDPAVMEAVAQFDPGNQYGVPYMIGTTGIGFIRDRVVAALGESAPLDSWDLIFKPENLSRLSSCGVAFLDAPSELFAATLHYLGKDPNSENPADYTGEAKALLKKLSPHVTYFHSSKYIDDLAAGEICIAIGWSGDVAQAMVDAGRADNGVEITYIIPKEGALRFFDMLAIPRDAPHVEEAHAFIDFLMRPEIAAENTNHIWYPNPIPASVPMINPEITGNTSIYPPPEVQARLYVSRVKSPRIDRVMNRAWTEIKTSR